MGSHWSTESAQARNRAAKPRDEKVKEMKKKKVKEMKKLQASRQAHFLDVSSPDSLPPDRFSFSPLVRVTQR